MSGLFTEDERDELRKTLGEEMRVLGLLDIPKDNRQPYPVDYESEKQLITLAREGNVANINPNEFGCTFYGLIFLLIRECWKMDRQPTTNRICWLLKKDGFKTNQVEVTVQELLDKTPVRMAPAVAVRRVREAFRRRAMLDRVVELDVLLRDLNTTTDTLARSFQKLVEVARGGNG